MADFASAHPFCWTFEYLPETHSDRTSHRPVIEVKITGPRGEEWAQRPVALVDSGSEFTLASRPIQQAIGASPDPATATTIGMGGALRPIMFASVRMAMFPPPDVPGEPIEWDADVGFIQEDWEPFWAVVLGRLGFFDKFTITLHGNYRLLVVEGLPAFDDRFGRGSAV